MYGRSRRTHADGTAVECGQMDPIDIGDRSRSVRSDTATYLTHTSIQHLNQDLAASQAQVKELQNRMQTAEGQEETLARQAGMTKKELAQRTAQLLAEQKAAAARLEKQQQESIQAVSGDIAGVKTDVGGVKTDVASTEADLEATKDKAAGRGGRSGNAERPYRQHSL